MSEDMKSKVRLRFGGGEEFEAEGSQEFIEKQKNMFLALIGKVRGEQSVSHTTAQAPVISVNPTPNRQTTHDTTSSFINAPKSATPATVFEPVAPEVVSPTRLWERLLKEDGDIVVLRQKFKITVQEAASLLLAGMRVLMKKGECSALELSRALKASHLVLPNRLDRLLAGEIQQGRIISRGAKRGRTYKLTEGGFAKAFVLAEKLQN